jgi:hypothetical protein
MEKESGMHLCLKSRRRRGESTIESTQHLCLKSRGRSIERAASLNLDQRRHRKIGYMYGNAKRRAEDKGLPFNLTKQDIADVWPKDDYCPALRIPLRIRIGNKTLTYTTDNSPNLDRIIPRLGYVKGNIAVVG